jgi:hypothetical protein
VIESILQGEPAGNRYLLVDIIVYYTVENHISDKSYLYQTTQNQKYINAYFNGELHVDETKKKRYGLGACR